MEELRTMETVEKEPDMTIPAASEAPATPWYHNVNLEDAETFIKSNLQSAVRSVIAVGYYLKCIRDGELYQKEGFSDIWEYARDRFGFSMSTTSRYMARNDRFSKDGNSPILDVKYREFNKSQLQEMLALSDDQLEQVTPDMTVRQIRELKRPPREIPYYEIPGQMEMVLSPEELGIQMSADEDGAPEAEKAVSERFPEYTIQTSDLLLDTDTEEDPELVIATSQKAETDESDCEGLQKAQQDPQLAVGSAAEQLSAYGTPRRIYPPDSLIACAGCEGGHNCFQCSMDCQIRQEDRYCREAPMGNPFPCEVVKYGFRNLPETCPFIDHDRAAHYPGSGEPNPCCKTCQDPCEYICGRAMKTLDQSASCPPGVTGCIRQEWGMSPEQQEEGAKECRKCWDTWKKQQDAISAGKEDKKCEDENQEHRELPTPAEEMEETVVDDMALLRAMLEKENADLKEIIKVNQDDPDPHLEIMIRKKKLVVGALAGMLCDLDQPVLDQPELPVMKNNDQRKEWLRDYKAWGLWYEDEHIGVRYYKYDFENGARLIVEEISETLPDGRPYESHFYHLVGGPNPPAHPQYGYGKWSWHRVYSHHPDSETELIEFLKEAQKR